MHEFINNKMSAILRDFERAIRQEDAGAKNNREWW